MSDIWWVFGSNATEKESNVQESNWTAIESNWRNRLEGNCFHFIWYLMRGNFFDFVQVSFWSKLLSCHNLIVLNLNSLPSSLSFIQRETEKKRKIGNLIKYHLFDQFLLYSIRLHFTLSLPQRLLSLSSPSPFHLSSSSSLSLFIHYLTMSSLSNECIIDPILVKLNFGEIWWPKNVPWKRKKIEILELWVWKEDNFATIYSWWLITQSSMLWME